MVVHFEDLAEDDDLDGQVLILEVNNSLFFFFTVLVKLNRGFKHSGLPLVEESEKLWDDA